MFVHVCDRISQTGEKMTTRGWSLGCDAVSCRELLLLCNYGITQNYPPPPPPLHLRVQVKPETVKVNLTQNVVTNHDTTTVH